MMTFEVARFHIHEPEGSYDMLEIRCPRKDCRARFWVGLAWALLDPPAQGRNCVWCGFCSAIPGQSEPATESGPWDGFGSFLKEPVEANAPKPRRIVRRAPKKKVK
jgi:hypothetical protein